MTNHYPRPTNRQQRVVLITGASTGFGRLIALWLAGQGFRVFGTSRRPEASQSPLFEMLPLDVRSEESVETCVAEVIARAGRIDVLINNAGYGFTGALEETSIAEAQALFDTNVFGMMRMTRAVLPHMRGQRSGHIIMMSSIVGVCPMPFEGIYAASKHAMEGYAETLRHEVRSFGIWVSLVEPGGFRTDFGTVLQSPANPLADYDTLREGATHVFKTAVDQEGADPIFVAYLIEQILHNPKPRLRYLIGSDARALVFFRQVLPASIMEHIIRLSFRLDGRKRAEQAMVAFTSWLRRQ